MPVMYTIDRKDWGQVGDGVLKAAMGEMVAVVVERALELVPKGATGNLEKGIGGRVEQGGLRGVVFAKARHAVLVEKGTKPHVITARKSKYLRIASGGALVFRKSVHHPGARAQPYLRNALEQSRGELEALLSSHGESYLGEALR